MNCNDGFCRSFTALIVCGFVEIVCVIGTELDLKNLKINLDKKKDPIESIK